MYIVQVSKSLTSLSICFCCSVVGGIIISLLLACFHSSCEGFFWCDTAVVNFHKIVVTHVSGSNKESVRWKLDHWKRQLPQQAEDTKLKKANAEIHPFFVLWATTNICCFIVCLGAFLVMKLSKVYPSAFKKNNTVFSDQRIER